MKTFIKNSFLIGFLALMIQTDLNAQFFQATLAKDGMDLVVKIRPFPGGGDVTTGFSGMEVFIRYDEATTPAFSYGSITTNTALFPTVSISDAGDNAQGSEAGYTNTWFVWSGIPTSSSLFADGVEVEVFRVALDIDPETGDFELAHNSLYSPYYLALNSEVGSDLTSITLSPGTNPFYGSGAMACMTCGPGGSDIYTFSLSASLPVELTSFQVEKIEKTKAFLEWTTASELQSSHFIIERSADGRNWNAIGQRLAQGSSTSTQYYYFRDSEAMLNSNAEGQVYYRLRMVDQDGSWEYSGIKNLAFDDRMAIKDLILYPNPTIAGVYLKTSMDWRSTGQYTWQLLSKTGQQIVERIFQPDNEQIQYLELPLGLSPGVYWLNLARNGHVLANQKLVIGEP